MKSSFFHKCLSLLLCLTMLWSLAACGNNSNSAVIRYEVDNLPKTFDPQLAERESELLAVRNLYEGLFRLDNNRQLQKALCTDYTVSEDEMTYTFTLRQDAVWRNGDPVTAEDFVFALQRAVDPIVKAPYAKTIHCIQNAIAILEGQLPTDALGVTAQDSYTLVVRLDFRNPEFLTTLTTAICMPCNQAFFTSTNGQYGLTTDAVLTNGTFRLRLWNEDSIRLNKSDNYIGDYPAPCSAVLLNLTDPDSETTRVERIIAGDLDAARIPDSQLSAATDAKLSITGFENICYTLIINPQDPDLGSDTVADILHRSFDRSDFSSSLYRYLSDADHFVPDTLTLGGSDYSDTSAYLYQFPYEPAQAKSDLMTYLNKENADIPSITILYPEAVGLSDIATSIARQWQENLGLYVNISQTEETKLKKSVASGSYQIAIVPITSADNTVGSFLSNFTATSSTLSGFGSAEYDILVADTVNDPYGEDALANAKAAESLLGSNPHLEPLVFGYTTYVASTAMEQIGFSITGGAVDFAFALKAN